MQIAAHILPRVQLFVSIYILERKGERVSKKHRIYMTNQESSEHTLCTVRTDLLCSSNSSSIHTYNDNNYYYCNNNY